MRRQKPVDRGSLVDGTIAAGEATEAGAKLQFKLQEDGSYLVKGANPESADYVVTGRSSIRNFDTIRLDALPDSSLPAKGPGRVKHG